MRDVEISERAKGFKRKIQKRFLNHGDAPVPHRDCVKIIAEIVVAKVERAH